MWMELSCPSALPPGRITKKDLPPCKTCRFSEVALPAKKAGSKEPAFLRIPFFSDNPEESRETLPDYKEIRQTESLFTGFPPPIEPGTVCVTFLAFSPPNRRHTREKTQRLQIFRSHSPALPPRNPQSLSSQWSRNATISGVSIRSGPRARPGAVRTSRLQILFPDVLRLTDP